VEPKEEGIISTHRKRNKSGEQNERKKKKVKGVNGRGGVRGFSSHLSDSALEKKDEQTITDTKKSNIDAIWEQMKMSSTPSVKVDTSGSNLGQLETTSPTLSVSPPAQPKTTTITERYDFAGEIVEITKEVTLDKTPSATIVSPKQKKGNLDQLLSSIGKPKKISTIQKSAIDWEGFKKKEGLEEELEEQSKGGYLEKRAFLQRTDLREFERERAIRMSRRKQ